MAMSRLKVTPSQLRSKVQNFENDAQSIRNVTSQMFSLIKELNGEVWSGNAATAYRGKFQKLDDDVNRMVKMVKEFSSDLRDIAAEYDRAENLNEAESKNLKTDVITF